MNCLLKTEDVFQIIDKCQINETVVHHISDVENLAHEIKYSGETIKDATNC